MKLYTHLIFCIPFITYAASISEKKCHSIKVNGKSHVKHVIMNGINRPYQLAMYPQHQTIFYSYNDGKDNQDTFGIAYVKMNDTAPTDIPEVKNGFALAIHESSKTIYFGSNEGIYQKDIGKSDSMKHIVKGFDIWEMFFHHHLYFITYPSMRLYKYDSEHKNATLQEHIKENIYHFAIDGKNNEFITTVNGLHMMRENEKERIRIEGPKQFRAIEVNHAGVAHFCANNSIYVVHDTEHKLVEIAEIKNVFGLTFDSEDHLIYSNPHEIVKLVPGECKESKDETKKKHG